MRTTERPARRLTRRVAAAAIAVIVAGCSGAATPAPTPTPTVAPTPSPTPVDVGAAFLAIVSDPDFSARIELDGTVEMGVTATLTGAMVGAGDATKSSIRVQVAGQTVETEAISVDGKAYGRTAPGPWMEVAKAPGAKDENLNEWLQTLATIEDLGVETKNGRPLHHLSVGDEPVPVSALGLDASTYKNPVVRIEFYAEEDGTPAVFAVDGTWIQVINGQDVTVEFIMDMIFSNVGSPIQITAPNNVWEAATSPLGYSMAHPDDYTVEHRDGYDAYVLDGVDWLYVSAFPDASGLSAEGFRDAIIETVAPDWGAPITTPVASTLAGSPGYLATYQYAYDDGTEELAYDVTAMHDGVGWELTLFGAPGSEREDVELFTTFVSTFAFTE